MILTVPSILGTLVGLLAVYRLVLFSKYRRTVARLGCFPVSQYPHRDPLLGYDLHRLLQRSKAHGDLIPALQQVYAGVGKGQTFQALTWGIKTLYTTNTDNLKAILTADFGDFGVEAIRKAFSNPWIEGGIMLSDGAVWKTSRAMVKPSLSKSHFWDLSKFGEHVDRLLEAIPGDDTTIDLQPLFFRFVRLLCQGLWSHKNMTLTADSISMYRPSCYSVNRQILKPRGLESTYPVSLHQWNALCKAYSVVWR